MTSTTSELPPYDRAHIIRWLGAGTVSKAVSYVPAVSDLEWDDEVLFGSVQGSRDSPYDVEVYFHRTGNTMEVEGECTCPVGYDCKHVAAVLLANLERRASGTSVVRAELVNWLQGFRDRHAANAKKSRSSQATQALVYALVYSAYRRRHEVRSYKASIGRDGGVRSVGESWSNVDKALTKPPQFIGEDDLAILRALLIGHARSSHLGFSLEGPHGAVALEKMLATGRLFSTDAKGKLDAGALRCGSQRAAHIDWQAGAGDRVQPVLRTDPASSDIVLVEPAWYVDRAAGEAGVVELPWDAKQLIDYLSMPPIAASEAPLVAAVLRDIAPDLPAPPTREADNLPAIECEPVPVLQLNTLPHYAGRFGGYGYTATPLDHATVVFDYQGIALKAGTTTALVKTAQGDTVHVRRRIESEKRRLAELRKAGLTAIPASRLYGPRPFPAGMLGLQETGAWPAFMQTALPALRERGWRVDMADEFSFNVVEIDAIDGHLREAADGCFDLEMGIVVGDRTIRLEPLLAELFERDRRWLAGDIERIADDEATDLKTDRGERLRLRADRLKPVVRVLVDLFEELGSGSMRVSRLDAGRLDALNETGRWQFHGDASIRQLAQHLRNGTGVQAAPVPRGLRANLRSYQQQGVSWMQFLRDHALSGVLADDMGLGKTMQALAHLLLEKEAGRLDRPALIVVPTSLIHNWCDEAQRFAPQLRMLSLHGAQRRERFGQIPLHDLVVTTYPLLWRDQESLALHRYHFLILDEAQQVKNASTKAAAAIRDIDARHRLCLTGTPLENHLGELWSLFDFLLPGFLGNQKDFTKRWRTPIEKNGDTVRRDLLARRVRPFMLRRKKDEVATELPPKAMMVRTVDLEGAQRDLYETVRTAMQEQVRAAIAAQGLGRSHIVVLDALLKLRQVCCDPRLVKLQKAAKVAASAKLELLLSMLPELIEEGRRILVFSQFTGMLALIAAALEKAGIAHALLTGDTADRAAPVRRFQAGEVPVFLISLKAGGVGLNLTAADTVIHYDPWWNPAAENQATDRAHRLGQDKPVFVYKLIVAGSIEEKIVALQDKKAALADGILSEDSAAAVKFSAEDLDALFAPMPEVA